MHWHLMTCLIMYMMYFCHIVTMDSEQIHFETGGSKAERWGGLLLSSQCWFSRPCISNASTFDSSKFWSLSRSSWICRRTTIREVWITLAEDTFSKPVFRWDWKAVSWWAPGICGKSSRWYIWFSRKPCQWKPVVVNSWRSFPVLSCLY